MATSGSSDWKLNTSEICTDAIEMNHVLAVNQTASSADISRARRVLNKIVKELSISPKMLFKAEELVIPITAASVVLGSDGYDYECTKNHIGSAATTPVTGANYKGYWKKLTTSAGSAHVDGTSYTSICEYDIDSDIISIGNGYIRTGTTQLQDTPLETHISTSDYYNLGDKYNEGKPTQVWFHRRRREIVGGTGTEIKSQVTLYPYPDSTDYVVILEAYRLLEDLDSTANDPDVFSECINLLTLKLAVNLHLYYGILSQVEFSQLKAEAKAAETRFYENNEESGYVQFSPF